MLSLLLVAGRVTSRYRGGNRGGDDDDDRAGDDSLQGACTNRVAGGAGNDLLLLSDESLGWGGDGDDTLIASGEARAYGRAGDDWLTEDFINFTGAPTDIFVTMTGGGGADSFTISDASANEIMPTSRTIITDFDPAQDRLAFEVPEEAEFSQSDVRVTSAFDPAGNFTLVTVSQALADGSQVPLRLIQPNGITSFAHADLRLTLEPLEN